MARLVRRRVLAGIATLWILSVILFVVVRVLPGNPALQMLGFRATPQLVAKVNHDFGLDKPLVSQYMTWLTHAVRGNFGYSLASSGAGGGISGRPVGQIVVQGLKVTAPLAILGMALAVVIGLPLGIFAATRRGSLRDGVLSTVSLIGISFPDFFVAFILILVLTVDLGWLPSVGYVSLFNDPLQGLRTLALPIIAVGIINAAAVARMTRSTLSETLSQPYVLLVRSRGTPESVVVMKHALRNAAIPILTTVGLQLGYLFGGVVVIETIFGLPGLGNELLLAVTQRDYPTIQALVLTFAAAFIGVNLIVDVMYTLLDPNVRHGG